MADIVRTINAEEFWTVDWTTDGVDLTRFKYVNTSHGMEWTVAEAITVPWDLVRAVSQRDGLYEIGR